MQGVFTAAFPRGRTMRALLALPLCILTACGGGGGGDSGGSAGTSGDKDIFQLSFQPGQLTASYYEGEAQGFAVTATASRTHPVPVQAAIIDSAGVLDEQVVLTPNTALSYTATLRASQRLAVGTYTGSLEVRVCEDSPTVCSKPVGGSPWRLPYQFTVKPSTNLSPLSAMPGGREWATYLGDAARSSIQPIALKAADFNRRWFVSFPDPLDISTLAVGGGLIVYSQAAITGSTPILTARRESDGSVAWTLPLGSQNYSAGSATIANGELFVSGFKFSSSEETELWRIDLATGQVLRHESFPFYNLSAAPPLYLDGKLYGCFGPLSGDKGLMRFDAITLQHEWTAPLPLSSCSPSTDGTSIYVFGGNKLFAINAATGVQDFAIDAPASSGDFIIAPPVLDGRGRAYVSAVNRYTSAIEASRLLAFDLNSRSIAWQQNGVFGSNAIVVGDMVYVSKDRGVEGRSRTDGRVQWSWVSETGGTFDYFGGGMVMSNGHLFVADLWTTQAIDLATGKSVWSENKGGTLAISGQGVLYIGDHFRSGIRAVNLR